TTRIRSGRAGRTGGRDFGDTPPRLSALVPSRVGTRPTGLTLARGRAYTATGPRPRRPTLSSPPSTAPGLAWSQLMHPRVRLAPHFGQIGPVESRRRWNAVPGGERRGRCHAPLRSGPSNVRCSTVAWAGAR